MESRIALGADEVEVRILLRFLEPFEEIQVAVPRGQVCGVATKQINAVQAHASLPVPAPAVQRTGLREDIPPIEEHQRSKVRKEVTDFAPKSEPPGKMESTRTHR